MGKSFCKVENKWCKFLKRGVCGYCKETLDSVPRCPRLTEIETVRLSDVLKEVKFEDVFEWLIYWFPDQESSKEGYESVFNSLLERKPKKHDLNDLFICVERLKDDFDPDDKDMRDGGGMLFLEGDKKNFEAAGHCAAYTFNGEDIFICHGYSVAHGGASILIQRPILWTSDGWPKLN